MKNSIDVYIRIDEEYNVIEINSIIFIQDKNSWIYIDSGVGDKYAHAQNHYLGKPLYNSKGESNYSYINGTIVDRGV